MMPRESQLQSEIGQTRPFRSLGQEAAIAVLRSADVLRRHFTAVLAPFGITPAQYNVLRILRGAGDAGLPTLEVSERMIEQACGITRLMDRLEAKGWVRRERSREDRRQVLCRLTVEGQDLLARLDGPVDAADEAAVAGLAPAQQQQLIGLLAELRSAHA